MAASYTDSVSIAHLKDNYLIYFILNVIQSVWSIKIYIYSRYVHWSRKALMEIWTARMCSQVNSTKLESLARGAHAFSSAQSANRSEAAPVTSTIPCRRQRPSSHYDISGKRCDTVDHSLIIFSLHSVSQSEISFWLSILFVYLN